MKNTQEISEITSWLLENGFLKYHGEEDCNCSLRLHQLHSLFWSDNLKHFSIGVFNETGKRGAGGAYKKWNMVMIPKPIYTLEQAKKLVESIT